MIKSLESRLARLEAARPEALVRAVRLIADNVTSEQAVARHLEANPADVGAQFIVRTIVDPEGQPRGRH